MAEVSVLYQQVFGDKKKLCCDESFEIVDCILFKIHFDKLSYLLTNAPVINVDDLIPIISSSLIYKCYFDHNFYVYFYVNFRPRADNSDQRHRDQRHEDNSRLGPTSGRVQRFPSPVPERRRKPRAEHNFHELHHDIRSQAISQLHLHRGGSLGYGVDVPATVELGERELYHQRVLPRKGREIPAN